MDKQISARNRVVFLGIFTSILLCALIIKLAYIQIVVGKTYAQKALDQRTLPIAIDRIRGDILDRNGIPFTRRKQQSFLLVFPGFLNDSNFLYDVIGSMTGLSIEGFTKILRGNTPYIKHEIINPNPDIENKVEKGNYPGLMIIRQTRRYDDSSIARHLIGYLRKSDYYPQSGIEKKYNDYLHSEDSSMVYAITDAKNRILPGIDYKLQHATKPYYNVQLTIDYYIQWILESAIDMYTQKAGGVVVDVETGDILALASRPNFDQNNIPEASQSKDSLWTVPMTAFPPGSLFKTIVAAVGLEEGLCTGNTPYKCLGEITINGTKYKCHPTTGGLGDINIRQAFAYSCNDAFISIAQQAGGQSIIDMAKKLGLGESLDIGLDNEEGNLPIKSEYVGAGIGNLALGQGKVEVTPLQIAQMMNTIANDGARKNLSLIRSIIDQSGQIIEKFEKPQISQQIIHPITARTLQEWMRDVTDYGTARSASSQKAGGTAGKTGTPQISGDADARYYGWFAGFFPQNRPKYVIVILVREESEGGEKAAQIFKEVADGITFYMDSLVTPDTMSLYE